MSGAAFGKDESGEKKVCPMGYTKKPAVREEPPDTPDRPLQQFANDCSSAKVVSAADVENAELGEMVPASAIPSTGRGNSEDGQEWLNPSPYQLHRALKRKGKAIPKDESFEVAAVHEMVTNATWDCIMEYESMYKSTCGAPKLARFEGRDGDYSRKAQFLNYLGINLPFDRHDWTVDRCGTEQKYVIDYYSTGEDENQSYNIDARPVGGPAAWMDRARLALLKFSRGDSFW